MKAFSAKYLHVYGFVLLMSAISTVATAEQYAFPSSASEVPTPVAGAVMHEQYVKIIGRMAYVWGWPMVNSFNRRATTTQAPEPGKSGGVVPVAPRGRLSMLNDYVKPDQGFVAAPNQDVVYGTAFLTLDEEPVVIQVPDFGGRYWIYALYDARTDQFGEFGRSYETKPGFYLLVGPNWKGETPPGIRAVVWSPTEFSFAGPRVFMHDTDEDRAAIQPLVNQINAYPCRTNHVGSSRDEASHHNPIIKEASGRRYRPHSLPRLVVLHRCHRHA